MHTSHRGHPPGGRTRRRRPVETAETPQVTAVGGRLTRSHPTPTRLAGLLTVCALAAACASSPSGSSPQAAPSGPRSTTASQPPAPPKRTQPSATRPGPSAAGPGPGATSPAPSIAQLAGQRIIYSYRGLTPPPALFAHIRAGEAAGVIFFSQNISSDAQIRSVIAQLRKAQQESPSKLPLLLMTDQEGGQVARMPGPRTPSAKQLGATGTPTAAASAGTATARRLSSVGMNVNLAPVLDVFRRPGDFADSTQRSFGDEPTVVADMAGAFTTAQQQHGVAATAKHFPGLGAAGRHENTDLGPVTLNQPLSTVRDRDEAPYPALLNAGVKLVMTSWAVYPALDAHRPAGLSEAVVRGELRQRLGYTGVTVTDALEAKALDAFGGTGKRAVAAATAGMDLLLCSAQDTTQGESAAQALQSALHGGQLEPSDFRAAVDRINALRASLGGPA